MHCYNTLITFLQKGRIRVCLSFLILGYAICNVCKNQTRYHIMRIMWRILYHQAKALDLAAVLGAGGHDIDAGGVNGAVTQNVGKFGNILFDSVKGSGKQLSQVVREHLALRDLRLLTQGFHFLPYIMTAYRLAASRDKYTP